MYFTFQFSRILKSHKDLYSFGYFLQEFPEGLEPGATSSASGPGFKPSGILPSMDPGSSPRGYYPLWTHNKGHLCAWPFRSLTTVMIVVVVQARPACWRHTLWKIISYVIWLWIESEGNTLWSRRNERGCKYIKHEEILQINYDDAVVNSPR